MVVKDEEILEKPIDAMDNLRMLADLNDGKVCYMSIRWPSLSAEQISSF